MEKNIITLAKYLINKGIENPLKLQKMLFFFRIYELKNYELKKIPYSGYFKDNFNFQAWVKGPANKESYEAFKLYFWGVDEEEAIFMDRKEIEKMDKVFKIPFKRYNSYKTKELVFLSSKNIEWQIVRKNLESFDFCEEYLNESNERFYEFA